MLAIRNKIVADARISATQIMRKESLTRGISCNLADLSDTGLRISHSMQMIQEIAETKKGFGGTEAFIRSRNAVAYLSEVLIEVNFEPRFVPRPFTAAIIAREMPAAMRPYSIAVAPDSSLTKRAKSLVIGNSICNTWLYNYHGLGGVEAP